LLGEKRKGEEGRLKTYLFSVNGRFVARRKGGTKKGCFPRVLEKEEDTKEAQPTVSKSFFTKGAGGGGRSRQKTGQPFGGGQKNGPHDEVQDRKKTVPWGGGKRTRFKGKGRP